MLWLIDIVGGIATVALLAWAGVGLVTGVDIFARTGRIIDDGSAGNRFDLRAPTRGFIVLCFVLAFVAVVRLVALAN